MLYKIVGVLYNLVMC